MPLRLSHCGLLLKSENLSMKLSWWGKDILGIQTTCCLNPVANFAFLPSAFARPGCLDSKSCLHESVDVVPDIIRVDANVVLTVVIQRGGQHSANCLRSLFLLTLLLCVYQSVRGSFTVCSFQGLTELWVCHNALHRLGLHNLGSPGPVHLSFRQYFY